MGKEGSDEERRWDRRNTIRAIEVAVIVYLLLFSFFPDFGNPFSTLRNLATKADLEALRSDIAEAGLAGPQGPQGEPGLDGVTGTTGSVGLNGADGATGVDGATGADGNAGNSSLQIAYDGGGVAAGRQIVVNGTNGVDVRVDVAALNTIYPGLTLTSVGDPNRGLGLASADFGTGDTAALLFFDDLGNPLQDNASISYLGGNDTLIFNLNDGGGSNLVRATLGDPSLSSGTFQVLSAVPGATNMLALASTGGGNIVQHVGTGDPEGVVTADSGSVFFRTDGPTGITQMYVKTDDGDNTDWFALATQNANDFDGVYDTSVANANLTMEIDNGDLNFDLSGSNSFVINTLGTGGFGINTTPAAGEEFHIDNGDILQTAGDPEDLGTSAWFGSIEPYVLGRYAYVTACGDGLAIFETTDPANPVQVGSITGLGCSIGVHVVGQYAYVASLSLDRLWVIDISDPTTPVAVGSVTDNVLMDFAQQVRVQGKYAYVTSERGDSLAVIDISDPTNPTIVGSIQNGATFNGARGLFVAGQYAYVTARNNHSLNIVDISDPTNPVMVGNVAAAGAGGLGQAVNVKVSGKWAYVASLIAAGGAPNGSNAFTVVDVEDPTNPTVAATVSGTTQAGSPGTNFANPVGLYNSGDYVYMLSTENGALGQITVFDVEDPTSPAQVGSLENNNLSAAQNIFVSGRFGYAVSYGNGLVVAKLTGTELPTASIGNITANYFNVHEDFNASGNIFAGQSVNVGGGGIFSQGGLSVDSWGEFNGHVAIGADAAIDRSTLIYPSDTFQSTLVIEEEYTDITSTDFVENVTNYMLLDPAGVPSAGVFAIDNEIWTDAGNAANYTNFLNANYSAVGHQGSGTASGGVYGSSVEVYNTGVGTITDAYGLYSRISNTSTGIITNGYGLYVEDNVNSGGGTFTNAYGLYVDDQSTGGATNSYNIYSQGSGRSVFEGNTGFGETDPLANLHVTETTAAPGVIIEKSSAGELIRFDAGGLVPFGLYNNSGSPEGAVVANTGSVAIDISGARMYVKTDDGDNSDWVELARVDEAFVQDGNSFGSTATLGTNDANGLRFETNNTDRLSIDTTGNVGVSTLAAATANDLCYNTAVQVGFNSLSTCSSASRYKNNVNNLSLGLDTLKQLRPVTFDWISDGSTDLGFIAEEVEAVNPLLVTYFDGQIEGVKYKQLTSLLTNAVVELDARVTALENAPVVTDPSVLLRLDALEAAVNSNTLVINTVDTYNLIVRGKVTFGSDTVGTATIPAGATEIQISFTNPYGTAPIVSITPTDAEVLSGVNYVVTNKTITGFKIVIDAARAVPITFDWQAFGQ